MAKQKLTNKLNNSQRTQIVYWLAEFVPPEEVVNRVKDNYGIDITVQAVLYYTPPKIPPKWRSTFESHRAAYLADIDSITLRHRKNRIAELEKMYNEIQWRIDKVLAAGGTPIKDEKGKIIIISKKDISTAAALLEQIAKEVGDRSSDALTDTDQTKYAEWNTPTDVARAIFGERYQLTKFHRWLLSIMAKFVLDYKMGLAPRVHISLPPQHGKSEAVRLMLSWLLTSTNDTSTAWVSYAERFAAKSSRQVRDWIEDKKPELTEKQKKAMSDWTLNNGSTMIAAGIGGQITGEAVDVLLFDDLLKNYQDYLSKANRDEIRYFLKSCANTRMHDTSGVLSIGTRWGQDDAIDMVLEEIGGKWDVHSVPALAVEGKPDPLGREPGEPLWPERHGKAGLEDKIKRAGPLVAQAIYQQSPLQVSGTFFLRDQWQVWNGIIDAAGNRTRRVRYWDLAFTKKGHGSASAMGYVRKSGEIVIEDIRVHRVEWPELQILIEKQAQRDGKDIAVGIEANGTQVGYYQDIRNKLVPLGYQVTGRTSKPDKESDARQWQTLQWGGSVHLGTVDNFIDRAERFPKNDIDEVDAVSGMCWLINLIKNNDQFSFGGY